MKKEDQEIARLRNLCETLFNDPLRSLCIVDSDGDIVMQNKSFTESFSSSESQTKLSEVLSKLLPLSELKRFDYALNTFFIPINDDNRAKFSIIEDLNIKGLEFKYRCSFQPFPNKSGKLCCLVGFSPMGGAVIEQEAGDPIPQEAQVNSPVLAVIKDLTRKLADINHCEVVLDTSNFNEDVIPPEQRAIVLDSLAQTLKFSIKNSIESPAERLTLNKGPEANVALTCSYQENIGGLDVPGVVLSYQDDGRGLNTREVFECAKKAHLTNTNSAEELRKEEVVGFLFDEAFSLPTDNEYDISNLNHLKSNILDVLHGKVRVFYEAGKSFSLQILVPDEKS